MNAESLLKEVVELQRKHYGDATALHLAMSGWTERASTLIAELGQEVGPVECPKCGGKGYTDEGDPEMGSAIMDCYECWPAPVGATLADAAGDPALTLEAARELLAGAARGIARGEYSPAHTSEAREQLKDDDVEWVVNDLAELGVKIGSQFFFCYKGQSLSYEDATHEDNGRRMKWRHVFKREFGECVHPVNYEDLRKCGHQHFIGTVSLDDSDDWKDLPDAAMRQEAE